MSLQSRGREKYLRSLKKRNIKKSLKEEEKEALAVQNKYRKKGKTESGIAYVAKSIQAERLLKKKEDQKKKVVDKKVVDKKVVDKKVVKKTKAKPTRAPGSEDFEPQSLADQKTHPDMSTVNKPDAKKKPKASDDRRKWGRDQMKRARASMGMKKGGGVKKLLKDIDKKTRREEKEFQKNTKRLLDKEDKKIHKEEKEFQKYLDKTLGMKHGGMVKKCKVDGIAKRGLTRAKHK